MDTFLQQIVNGLTLGSVYAVVALGYTMVYGIIQLINFAHGEVVMIGAHLDSWQGGTGATDNAAGCAVMIFSSAATSVICCGFSRS